MHKLRVLIVGGVAGGASAAARLRRLTESAEIIMFEKGDYISFANCGLPYHIEGSIQQREKLIVMTPQKFENIINVDVRVKNEVLSINRQAKTIKAKDLTQNKEYEEQYDKLILSPGAFPFVPPMKGLQDVPYFTLRSINDMDAIIKYIQEKQPKKALVIGGGFIGLEVAEALQVKGMETTIVELAKQVMPPIDPEMAALVHQELMSKGVKLALGKSVTSFAKGQGNTINCTLNDQSQLETELVILSIGVRPDTKLAKEAGLQLGVTQAIKVNEQCQTNDPDIYAVGDAIEHNLIMTNTPGFIPLAGPANRQGRIVADHICGKQVAYQGTQGTAICKVFDVAVGSVGINEFRLKQMNIPYKSAILHASDHASYYPNACMITMKILFGEDGKIYGFQAFGKSGVDRRIDAVAVAMRAGMTVFDLEHLELAYAPPYGSAKDPVNIAGFVASNILRGDLKLCSLQEMTNPSSNQVLLDVRGADELQKLGSVPGCINIPLDQLRNRVQELPKDKEIITYCQIGGRSWKATRILANLGFNVKMWNGGYTSYKVLTTYMNP